MKPLSVVKLATTNISLMTGQKALFDYKGVFIDMRSNDRDLHYLEEKKDASLDSDQPFEPPAKELVPGP